MPYAGVNGQRLYYEVGGDGDTIVLLHGSFADADIMEAPATGLASGFRALRIDRRGNGRSSAVDSPFSLADEVADIAALLDWFGVDKTHFLTHDDGSEVALEFALAYPDRTLSIALLAPTLDGFAFSDEWIKQRAELVAGLRQLPRKTVEDKLVTSPAFAVAKEKEGMFDRIADIYRRFTGAAVRHDRIPVAGPPQAQRLGGIRSRCGIFVGEKDEPERLRSARAIFESIPGSELVTFPGLSRFLHIEESRMVMRRLTDFYLPEPEIER